MNKKPPMKATETVKLLAEFIVTNFHHCPVNINVDVPGCECWGEEYCKTCIRKHADQLKED